MICRKGLFIICNMLITCIILIGPGQKRIPVSTNSSLTFRTFHSVVIRRRREEKVVGVTHGVFAYVVYAVYRMANIAR